MFTAASHVIYHSDLYRSHFLYVFTSLQIFYVVFPDRRSLIHFHLISAHLIPVGVMPLSTVSALARPPSPPVKVRQALTTVPAGNYNRQGPPGRHFVLGEGDISYKEESF